MRVFKVVSFVVMESNIIEFTMLQSDVSVVSYYVCKGVVCYVRLQGGLGESNKGRSTLLDRIIIFAHDVPRWQQCQHDIKHAMKLFYCRERLKSRVQRQSRYAWYANCTVNWEWRLFLGRCVQHTGWQFVDDWCLSRLVGRMGCWTEFVWWGGKVKEGGFLL